MPKCYRVFFQEIIRRVPSSKNVIRKIGNS